MPDGDITIGELSRTISAMQIRIDGQFAAINRRFDSLEFVHREAYTVQMTALTDRVEQLEDSKKWFARTVAAAFLVAFLSPLLVALVISR